MGHNMLTLSCVRCFLNKVRLISTSNSTKIRFYSVEQQENNKIGLKHRVFKRETSFSVLSLIAGTSALVFSYFFFKWKLSSSAEDKVTDSINYQIHRDELIDRTGHLILHDGTWLPIYLFPNWKLLNEIKKFQLKDGDILVTSFPKSGTTWLQEIIFQITNGEVVKSAETNMEEKFPYLEHVYPGLKAIEKRTSPRLIKTHLSYHLLPSDAQQGKVMMIYIARNAKDVCVSYYHYVKMLSFLCYKGDFNHFYKSFVSGKVGYGPWMEHVLEFWQHRNDKNVLFVTYEDLHENAEKIISQIAKFLGYSLSDEELLRIARLTSFVAMKENQLVNYSWWDDLGLRNKNESHFMRKGKVGDWRNYFTQEMKEEIEEKCMTQLKSIDLTFQDG